VGCQSHRVKAREHSRKGEAPAEGLDRGWLLRKGEFGSFAYLSGCVATACWWCAKQPPSPTAADMMMAQAIKMRMSVPSLFSPLSILANG
jgi:hypothetical protein